MTRTVPTPITTTELSGHPAVVAWTSLGGEPPARAGRLRGSTRSKPALYRLDFEGRPSVFAKHGPARRLAPERRVYGALLPHIPVTAPRYHGSCDEPDGTAWMFVEDVGDACFGPHDPVQRRLAATWLAHLHGAASALVSLAELPSAGAERYLAHLRAARTEMRAQLGNRALTRSDLGVLHAILDRCEVLEELWPRLERSGAEFPVTLVHADFQPKNVRLRESGGELALHPIDWETAGWGVPAADLAFILRRELSTPMDPQVYVDTIRGYLPRLDLAAVRRLSILGHVFQAMSGVHWATADLRFESARCLIRPISSMRIYIARIDASLQASADWLA